MYIPFIFLALCHVACAVRTQLRSDQKLCPKANLVKKPRVFALEDVLADVDPLRPWTLKADATCDGPTVCEAALTPHLDLQQPALHSKLLITVFANCTKYGQQLFLCPDSGSMPCVASLDLPSRSLRPHHLFSFLISSERMQILDSRRFFLDEVLEVVFVLEILAALGALVWLISEVVFSKSMPSSHAIGTSVDRVDERLQLSGALEVMADGLLNALCFLLGCLLWILASSQFLHKYGSQSSTVDTLILSIPAIFGPCALLRLFLSICRRQLYYTLFRRRILLALEVKPFWKDGLLLCSMMGLFLGLSSVITGIVLASMSGEITKDVLLTQLLVFLSPLYTMVSAFLYELDGESTCVKRRCVLQLEEVELTSASAQAVTTKHEVQVVPERTFCEEARKNAGSDPESLTSRPDAERLVESNAPAFSIRDMMWANRLVGHTSDHKVSLLVFMPVLMICILSLGLGCTVLNIKHRSDVPQLIALEPSVGRISPPISADMRQQCLYVDIMRRSVALETSLDLSQTTSLETEILSAKSKRSAENKELKQSTKVSLHETGATYPVTVHLDARTRAQVQRYELQIFEVSSFLRSVLLTGQTTDGRSYQRCVLGNALLVGNIGMPASLKTLEMEVTTLNIPYGIPIGQAAQENRFSTVFLPANETDDCEEYCLQHANCYESKVRSTAGCFLIFGPSALDCLQLHRADHHNISSGSVLNDLHLKAEVCTDKSQKDCRSLQSLAADRLKSDVLNPRSIQIGNLALRTHVESSGSNFFVEGLEGSRISLYNGTPPVNTILTQALPGSPTMKIQVVSSKSGFDFEVKLSYDPTEMKNFWNNSFFSIALSALVEDPMFKLEWPSELPSQAWPIFARCEDDFLYSRYQVCNGPLASPIAKLTVNTWAPKQDFQGRLIPVDPEFFQAADVRLRITTEHGLEPLQGLIRENCSALPVCLGDFHKCFEEPKCQGSSKRICAFTCGREAYKKCRKLRKSGTSFLAFIDSDHKRITESRLGPIISATPASGMEKFFTYPVIKDIAAHCGLRSGLMHLVSETLKHYWNSPQKARAMQLMEQLSFNPDFRGNETAKQNHLLLYLSRYLPVRWMSLRDVVLYSHEFAPLQFAFCSVLGPSSVTPELLASVIDKIAAVASVNEIEIQADWSLTLQSLIRCARRPQHKPPVPPLQCRQSPSMDVPSLFAVAPDETTFELLLPYCDIKSGPIEKDGSTVLHLAAARGWSKALAMTLEIGPDSALINATRNVQLETSAHYSETLLKMTAVHEAAHASSSECLETLLAHGAAMERKATLEVMGHTIGMAFEKDGAIEHSGVLQDVRPLHLASERGCLRCIQLFLLHNASVNAEMLLLQNKLQWQYDPAHFGVTGDIIPIPISNCTLRPLDLAVQSGCQECILALLGAGAKSDELTLPGRLAAEDRTSPLLQLLPDAKLKRCDSWYVRKGGHFLQSLRMIAGMGQFQEAMSKDETSETIVEAGPNET